jgi:hypothetical protein
MARSNQLMRGLYATTALAAVLAIAPVQFAPDLGNGVLMLKANAAFARGGSDGGGDSGGGGGGGGGDHGGDSGRSGGDDGGGGDDHGGDSGGGGSDDGGGDDHGGDSGGGGSDDGGGDDHGGDSGGGGSDDGGGDDHGGDSGRDGSDDGGGDDHGGDSGHGGSDDGGGDDRGSRSGRGGGDDRGGDDRADRGDAKVEIEGDKIEVTFADGTKQEIEDGRFEQKNAAGRTVVERPATRQDFEQLRAAAAGAGAPIEQASSRLNGSTVEVSGRDIEITHADGWKEEIESGRYEMKDPNNNTVVERAATSEDFSRLGGLLEF